jgi:hypothetical protein
LSVQLSGPQALPLFIFCHLPCALPNHPQEPASDAGNGADPQDVPRRCCTLCQGFGVAGLGPFMPVQIQNGQLEWVHRDCAMWSPEVSVDGAGRLLGLAATVRRGLDTACTRCGGRGATLVCWCQRGCGQALHLPCARKIGCYFSVRCGGAW